MMSSWKNVAVSASALLVIAACEDRGGGDRRAGGTGSTAERQATGQGASGQQATAQGGATATGQVVSAKSDELVLKQQGQDKELKLKVGPQTQVLIDGKQSTIENLREGAQVRASYDASQQMATRIEAMGGATGSAADRPGGSAGTTGGLGGASSSTPGQTGGPGGESSTSASQPGAPTGTESGSGTGTQQPGSR